MAEQDMMVLFRDAFSGLRRRRTKMADADHERFLANPSQFTF
jgi:hypothetical protein